MASEVVAVVAIDFGTTYTGCAFSFVPDFLRDPLDIKVFETWGGGKFSSNKTPTCLLLDKEKKFMAFGFDAEEEFAEMEPGQQKEHFYFQNFKMSLHNNSNVGSGMQLSDINQKKLPALEVFSHSLKYMKDHFMELLDEMNIKLRPDEIRWVLTVPAIWTDRAKELMRKSAEKAGILPSQLLIALEPEAASILYKYTTTHAKWNMKDYLLKADVADRYMIVDLGGGTADITVHEVCSDGSLKEVCRANGDDCGGLQVNCAFIKKLGDIIHLENDFGNELKEENMECYIDFMRNIETKKKNFDPDKARPTVFDIPVGPIDRFCKRIKKNIFLELLKESSHYPNDISLVTETNKLRFSVKMMSDLFVESTQNIIKLIENTIESIYQGIHYIILVGGFAESKLVQDAVKQKLLYLNT